MSIASEITRIQTAKENIRTSIINKGGTLASGALLNDYAAAIDAIPASASYDAGTLIYEGTFSETANTFAVTTLPNGDSFSFDKIVIELSNVNQGQNVQKRTYWRADEAMTGYNEPLIIDSGSQYRQGITYNAITTITIEDNTYIGLLAISQNVADLTSTTSYYQRKEHNGLNKITAYGWWSWNCPAGTHIKITGYNN